MREMAISKFKINCLAVVAEVQRTGTPIRITRFGKPLAEVVPAREKQPGSWLGAMRDEMEILGDIVGPVGAFEYNKLPAPRKK